MSELKGRNGSYFHNNYLHARDEDRELEVVLIDAATTDDIICRLNGYAIIPIEKYYNLLQEDLPEGTSEKIKEMNERLAEI